MVERTALTRLEPFRELTSLEKEMDRLFNRASRWFDWPVDFWYRPAMLEGGYIPSMEVFDRDGHTVVKLEVPGVEMEDIDISVTNGLLTIRGEKKREEEIKEESYYCSERSYGSFRRTLSVPGGIDSSNISATYHGGVLEVSLPKVEGKQEHKVKIRAKK